MGIEDEWQIDGVVGDPGGIVLRARGVITSLILSGCFETPQTMKNEKVELLNLPCNCVSCPLRVKEWMENIMLWSA